MEKTPIRILQIVSSLSTANGILSVVLNWHRCLKSTDVQFDYLYFIPTSVNQEQEIKRLGGYTYCLPCPATHSIRFLWETYRFFKTHRYCTVHSHVTGPNLIFYPLAKLFGTKNIIQHAHSVKWGLSLLSNIRNYVMLHAVWPLITHKMACSQLAGEVYYGKDFTVIPNGINIEKFTFNPRIRTAKRKKLGIENNFVLGHIGRIAAEKNHTFLIDVFAEVVKKNAAARLMLAGKGALEEKIKKYVQKTGLADKVCFLGVRQDVAEVYQALDCFVFPSLHEGLGIVALEAQAAGLPCVLADTLPREVFICNYKKMPLGSAEKWAREIISVAKDFKRADTSELIKAAGFSAKEIAQQMQDFYGKLEEKR